MTEPAAPDFQEADLDDVVDLPPDEGDAGGEILPGGIQPGLGTSHTPVGDG